MYLELRLALCASMLAIASILDIKSREISDKVWIVFGGAGAILTIIEILDGLSSNGSAELVSGTGARESAHAFALASALAIHSAVGIAIISAVGYATYKLGLFGGADPKALIAIAIILPIYTGYYNNHPSVAISVINLHSFTALTVFSNAVIVSMAAMMYNVIRNSISLARGIPIFEDFQEGPMRKALAFAVGFPSNTLGKYVFVMEENGNESTKRKFRFNPASYDEFASQDDDQFVQTGTEKQGKRRRNTWVTHALPFIVYITIGFVIAITIGDLMALLLKSLMG